MSPEDRLLLITHHWCRNAKLSTICPGAEEQRAFCVQFLGTLAGVVLVALSFAVQGNARSVLWGGGVAMVWLLARARQRRKKRDVRRWLKSAVADDGLHLTDDAGRTRIVAWPQISACDVTRRAIARAVARRPTACRAREVQDGMTLVREVLQKTGGSLPSGEAAGRRRIRPPSTSSRSTCVELAFMVSFQPSLQLLTTNLFSHSLMTND